MDKPWYRELFRRPQKSDPQSTKAKAAEGNADTQFHLGLMFSNSGGKAEDYLQAAQWYLKAANLNHALAQFNLGLMYANGQGVVKNDGEAMMWIRKAAEQGDAGAQFNLGARYDRCSANGQEMDAIESKIESYKWFRLAAAQGYKQANASCERVTLKMSFAEVAEGNHRVASFLPGNTR